MAHDLVSLAAEPAAHQREQFEGDMHSVKCGVLASKSLHGRCAATRPGAEATDTGRQLANAEQLQQRPLLAKLRHCALAHYHECRQTSARAKAAVATRLRHQVLEIVIKRELAHQCRQAASRSRFVLRGENLA